MKKIINYWKEYKEWIKQENEKRMRECEYKRWPVPAEPFYLPTFQGFMDWLENK
jgi:hypothetical protein